jgi:FkbM family methyltransferase
LIFQVRDELQRVDTGRIRFARLPGGARLAVTLHETLWEFLYFHGTYELESTRFAMRFLRPGDVFFDIGANAGYYTLIAGSAVGLRGKIYAIEPNPDIVALLNLSLAKNAMRDRVVLETLAFGAAPATGLLQLPADDHYASQASLISSGSTGYGGAINVRVMTLDEYCARQGISAIRLMKIDVEGAEYEVLAGATNVLRSIRPQAILCEFVPARRRDAQIELLRLFERNNYEAFSIGAEGLLSKHNGDLPSWDWGNLCFMPAGGGSVA